jgi:predicted aconitase with swiveling domain
MIIGKVNSLTAIGAVVMRVPTVTDFDGDPTEKIATGDWVKVDAERGIVEITKKTGEKTSELPV